MIDEQKDQPPVDDTEESQPTGQPTPPQPQDGGEGDGEGQPPGVPVGPGRGNP